MLDSSFEITLGADEAITVDDMGDEWVVLSQVNEGGQWERVALSYGHLKATVAALEPRYGGAGKTQIAV